MASRYPHLLAPIKVGNLVLKNRLITTSMNPGREYTTKDGRPTDIYINYLAERAAGKVGLICQSVIFYPRGEGFSAIPAAYREENIPDLRRMSDAVHRHGGLLVGQALSLHSWRRSADELETHFGPSPVKVLPSMPDCQPMTIEDIGLFTSQVATCGAILKEAGWDGIELIAGVGSTLSRFLSPATNRRTDEYGGSLENRCRFVVEVVKAVRKACGAGYPVLIRWSPVEFIKGGNEIEDGKKIAPLLEKAGVSWHNLSVGWHETSIPLTTKDIPDGHWAWIAGEIKKVATVPVVSGYRQTDPDVMERILAEGKADLIGGARYIIADPEFPLKLMEGRPEDIRRCVSCCRCLDDVVSRGKPLVYCSVNPRLGPELLKPVERAAVAKKVMVIGSGPAGLSAAVTAAKRGHDVTVYEQGPRIGGCLVLSAILSPTYDRLTRYYRTYLQKHPEIKVILNRTVTRELVQKENPEVVIAAVGGRPVSIDVPGAEGKNVVFSHDFLELLNGKAPQKSGLINRVLWNAGSIFFKVAFSPQVVKKLLGLPWPFGKQIAIIGGGLAGCEMGKLMLAHKRTITIIEEKRRVGYELGASDRFHLLSQFKNSPRAHLESFCQVVEITSEGVRARRQDGSEFFCEADTVAVTLGFSPNEDLLKALEECAPILKAAGDCKEPRLMADATKDGYLAAMGI